MNQETNIVCFKSKNCQLKKFEFLSVLLLAMASVS